MNNAHDLRITIKNTKEVLADLEESGKRKKMAQTYRDEITAMELELSKLV